MSDIPRQPAPEDEVDLGPQEDTDAADEIETVEDAGDDDAGDGEGEDEGGEDEEVLAEEPPAPRRGGGSQTIREQRARAQEAERRAQEAEQRVQALERQVQTIATQVQHDPQAQARVEQEWQQRLEMMTPGEQAQAIIQRGRQEFGAALQQVQFQANDRADKQAYDAEARVNPIFKKYQPEVERVLAAERAQGRNPDREVILDVLYGREMRQRATRAAPAQRRAGAARVAGQQTRPTGARSTATAASRRPAPGSPEDDDRIIAEAIARGEKVF